MEKDGLPSGTHWLYICLFFNNYLNRGSLLISHKISRQLCQRPHRDLGGYRLCGGVHTAEVGLR